MYRYLVFALLGGAFLIGGYYVREAGIERVFSYDPVAAQLEILGTEDVIGKYLCDPTSGCKVPYQITLYLNGAAKLSRLETGTTSEVTDRGDWKFIDGGLIALSLQRENEDKSDSDAGEVMTKTNESIEHLVIQSISSSTLTKLIYNQKAYPFMTKPKFKKQEL